MDQFFQWPFEARSIVVWALGACAAAVVNWAVYSFGYEARPLSPWCRRHPHDELGRWFDRIPVIGWLRLQRKGKTLGYEFWLRPMIVEVVTGLLVVALYWWIVEKQGLIYPPGMRVAIPSPALFGLLHGQFLVLAEAMLFMLAASLVDIDEKTIPDEITVPGTIVALVAAAVFPDWRLPSEAAGLIHDRLETLHFASPRDFPEALGKSPHTAGLVVALAGYWLWCAALLPRTWRQRHGLRRALVLFFARIFREPSTPIIALLAILGGVGIVACWLAATESWEQLLSAIIGMAAGGALVWGVRWLGSWALGREAMGFGDVVLLAMIGAFTGWQGVVMVFFFAPFAGLAVGLVQMIATRNNVLPFGPYLCLAAVVVMVGWGSLWNRFYPIFYPGWLVPAALGGCLLAMPVLLILVRSVRMLLGGGGDDNE